MTAMTEELRLTLLKMDLQIVTDKMDAYLMTLLSAAKGLIGREGIVLTESDEDVLLQQMYAAYLYRKRREESTPMPRMLRYALNNRLISQKAREADV